MKMYRLAARAAAASLAALTSAALTSNADAAVNLLTNGSFETGDFAGWTLGGPAGDFAVVPNAFYINPEDGTSLAEIGTEGTADTLSQTFTDSLGKLYSVTGYVFGLGGTPSSFSAAVSGTTYVTINPYPASTGWDFYHFQFTGTGSDTFVLTTQNDPSYNLLDNFSVAAVPELSTWGMMLIGFGGVAAALRRRVVAL